MLLDLIQRAFLEIERRAITDRVTIQNIIEGDPILAPAAIEAVKQWRYEPTRLDGKPVDVQTTIEVTFTLKP